MSNTSTLDENIDSDNYTLPRNEIEGDRLELQHSYFTEMLGGRLIVDENVHLGATGRVLDSGTGTAVWLLALSKEVPETVELVGADISTAMFPKEVPKHVKLYETAITRLPGEWENTFDFINQRLLMAAFTVPQWRSALSELKRVLKPGGAIQLIEVGRYGTQYEPVPLPMTEKTNKIATAVMGARDLLGFECGRRLPRILEEVGFMDVQLKLFHVPLGKHWGALGVKGSKVWYLVLRTFGAELMANGGQEICKSQAEADELVDRAKDEWDENPGVYRETYVITARKAS